MVASEVGHLKEAEFLGLNLEDVNENDLTRQMRNGLPVTIPWKREVVRLGTCFHVNVPFNQDFQNL